MTQGLRMQSFLPEHPGAVPSTNWQLSTTYNSSSQGNEHNVGTSPHMLYICACRQTLICIKRIFKSMEPLFTFKDVMMRGLRPSFTWKKKIHSKLPHRGFFLFLLRFGCHARKAISFTPEGMQHHGYISHAWFSRRI